MKNNMNYGIYSGAMIASAPIAGQITVANESQMDAANLSQALTEYIAGCPAPDLEMKLDDLFPYIPTGRIAEFQSHDDEQFLTEVDDSDIRAAAANFKRVEYNGGKQTIKTQNKGLTFRMDHDRVSRDTMGNRMPGWQQRYVDMLRKRLIRAEILRGYAVLRGAAGVTGTLNHTWDSTANPDGDLRNSVRLGRLAKGLKPTRVIIGDSPWQLRQDAYEAADRPNHVMANHASYSEMELASYLGVEKVMRDDDLFQIKKTKSKEDMIEEILIYHAEKDQTEDDPSNIKRFVSNTDAGGRWGVYVHEHSKYTDITVEHYSVILSPLTQGVRRIVATA